ncbi:hypothetical protein J7L87_05870, partial [bacterium]|nr:hypothetical protein [bacterium]
KIQAATDVNIVQSTLVSGGDIGIQATANDINISDYSTLWALDETQLVAGRDIIISSDSTSTSADDATLTAGRNVEIGYVEAGNGVGIEATTGMIFDNNGDAVNIIAQKVALLAASGIGYTAGLPGTPDAIEIQGRPIGAEYPVEVAANTTNGDIWIRTNTEVNGDLTISSGVTVTTNVISTQTITAGGVTTGNGDIRIENGYIRFENGELVDTSPIPNVVFGGDMTIAGVIQANGGSVKLHTNGSILDNNTTTPYDVIATDTSELLAFDGTIGKFDPNGSGYEPIEVNINPGDLYVYASDENFFVSVGIDGIVQPRDVLLCYPNYVPPGLIFFNGRMDGGMRSNQWFRAVSPSVILIGVEAGPYSMIMLDILKADKYFEQEPAYWMMTPELEDSLDIVMR